MEFEIRSYRYIDTFELFVDVLSWCHGNDATFPQRYSTPPPAFSGTGRTLAVFPPLSAAVEALSSMVPPPNARQNALRELSTRQEVACEVGIGDRR